MDAVCKPLCVCITRACVYHNSCDVHLTLCVSCLLPIACVNSPCMYIIIRVSTPNIVRKLSLTPCVSEFPVHVYHIRVSNTPNIVRKLSLCAPKSVCVQPTLWVPRTNRIHTRMKQTHPFGKHRPINPQPHTRTWNTCDSIYRTHMIYKRRPFENPGFGTNTHQFQSHVICTKYARNMHEICIYGN